MKRFIVILFLICCFSGCYIPDSVTGHYYVKSETPVEITYTIPEGEITETTNLIDVYFEIKEEDYPEIFKHKIKIISDNVQPITIHIEFEENENHIQKEIYLNDYYTDNFERGLFYYPPWNEDCANVVIGL